MYNARTGIGGRKSVFGVRYLLFVFGICIRSSLLAIRCSVFAVRGGLWPIAVS